LGTAGHPVIADLEVLAIDTLQVAVCEKDVADAVFPADDWLLPAMNTDGCNTERCIAPAYTRGRGEPVGMTVAWAKGAIGELPERGGKGIIIHPGVLFLVIFGVIIGGDRLYCCLMYFPATGMTVSGWLICCKTK